MEIRSPYTTLDPAALGGAAATSAPGARPTSEGGGAPPAASLPDSSELSAFARAAAAASQLPEVRQERVDALQQQIASGSYQVAPQDVADALLSHFRN
jgi:flagellar biosynthesis anti-sigma factor FlgM